MKTINLQIKISSSKDSNSEELCKNKLLQDILEQIDDMIIHSSDESTEITITSDISVDSSENKIILS